jgi:LuxR family maltose regulon positive regulatory protein
MVNIREQELIMLARVRLAQGRNDEVAAILAPLSRDAEAGGRRATLLESLALQARALDAQGDREAAVAILIKALALAEPEGFVRIFVDEGQPMRSLLLAAQGGAGQAGAGLPSKAYISGLLAALPAPAARVPAAPAAQEDALIEALTARETQVLYLIAAGDSNATIAGKLVISLSAVKKHTGNIFAKLGVTSRTQAVARARQLGLLG